MADSSRKTTGNAEGAWFVDESCIACGLCTSDAPENFELGDNAAFIKKQPEDSDEESACSEAAENCPVQAIGKD
jgi:ferredoxin